MEWVVWLMPMVISFLQVQVLVTNYYDSYTYDATNNLTHSRGKLGDATKETLTILGTIIGGWYEEHSYSLNSNTSWVLRSSHYANGPGSGIFAFFYNNGSNSIYYSSRAILS